MTVGQLVVAAIGKSGISVAAVIVRFLQTLIRIYCGFVTI
jgi:hypothetical protein